MEKQFKHGIYAYRSLKDLHKHPSNPRFIDDDDFKTLVASIKKNPDYFEARPLILSDRTGELVIIAGNELITNDNLSKEDWEVFVRAYLQNILKTCQGAIYICMSNKEMYSNQNIFIELGGIWSAFIIWKKNQFVMGMSDYQRQYEPILYGWKKGVTKFWCGDRKQSDIWEINKPASSPEHPTMKPIELCGRAINNSSGNNNIIQDLFLGSGSTMVAAHQINRQCYGLEIEPKYCQVIIDRMLKLDPTLKIKKNGKLIN